MANTSPTGIKSFFDIANILLKKLPYPSDEDIQKHCNQWMLCSYFSCDEQLAPLAAELARYKMSNKEYFDVIYYGIPKTSKFIRYAAQKMKADITIKNLTRHYECSVEIAKQYMALISEQELEKINEMYEQKGIKK